MIYSRNDVDSAARKLAFIASSAMGAEAAILEAIGIDLRAKGVVG